MHCFGAEMYRGQAGLHDLKGQQVPLPPNVTRVYIAGGAWVNGGFVTTAPGTAVTVSGRGVISGSAQPFLKDPAGLGPCHYNGSWCWSLVNMDRGEGHVLEGLVLHDPPKYDALRTPTCAGSPPVDGLTGWCSISQVLLPLVCRRHQRARRQDAGGLDVQHRRRGHRRRREGQRLLHPICKLDAYE